MTTALEYLCVNTAGDTVIVVTNTDSRSFNMYIATGGDSLREVTVFDLQRMRDGGTTYIFTAEGTFYAPSPLRPPTLGPRVRWLLSMANNGLHGRRLRMVNS